MAWMTNAVAWEVKCLWLELAHQLIETGRICSNATCTARSEIAFQTEGKACRWWVGFCGRHAVEFACEHHETIVGLPRRLEADDVLDGPLADVEEDDEEESS